MDPPFSCHCGCCCCFCQEQLWSFFKPKSQISLFLLKKHLNLCHFSGKLRLNPISTIMLIKSILSPIFQWLFLGIKMFPKIFLFVSKIRLMDPNLDNYFRKLMWKKTHRYFCFFHWNPYLKTDSANLLILFSVNDFHKKNMQKFLRNLST